MKYTIKEIKEAIDCECESGYLEAIAKMMYNKQYGWR